MEGITSPPMIQGSSKNSFFTPLLISMLGIVVTCLAIIAYHFLLVKFCLRRHASTTRTVAQQGQPPTGVDEKVLKTIPIVAFAAVKSDQQLEECVVCLGELEDQHMVRLLPNCKHAFHVGCIDQWFAAHTSCPLCRSPIHEHDHEQTNAAPSLHQSRADDSIYGESNESSATSEPPSAREQSFSLVRSPPMWSRLKRSMSMDPSLVVINLQIRDDCDCSSSSRGMLRRSGSCLSHFDRVVSSKWLTSFSRLRMGKSSNGAILPY